LRLYRLSDVVLPAITALGYPSAPPWADGQPSGLDFAPQPSTCSGLKIQTNDSRIQNVVWRNGKLWAAHTVFYPSSIPTRAAVQWWQVQTDSTVVQRGVIDSGTPSLFHAFPSLAVNRNDDVLIGFSSFSDADFASARYAFRLATDPPGSMQAPSLLKAGEDCYFKDGGSGRNRWGDYSATVVDPTDDTRLWTIQEYAETESGGFDRWGTWWGQLDPTPAVAITDPSVVEGNAGTTDLVFDVTLSVPTSQTVTVQWRTLDQTATAADGDFVAVASGTVTFAPGDTAETIVVAVKGDIKREAIETLQVELTASTNATRPDPLAVGTILDDDPVPQMSIGDRQAPEGNPTGTTPFGFSVTLSNPSAFPISASWAASNGTATGGTALPADYQAPAGGTVSFAAGETTKTVTVSVFRDSTFEADETFGVTLSGPTNATIQKAVGTGVILNDDVSTPQPGVASLTVVSDGNATSGRNRLQWVNPATTADAIEIRVTSATLPATCSFPATAGDGSGLSAPAYAGPGLVQAFTHTGLALGDVFCYSVFLRYPPSVYSAAANATGRPFDATTGRVKWRYFTGAATLVPPTVGSDAVLVSSNDRLVHAAVRGPAGGAWPSGWSPPALGWPAQERSAIVPLAVGPRVFYGTQDGWVQAIDAKTGAKVWETRIGTAGGAAPAGIFTAFGGAWDYLLVGTAEADDNRFYALDPVSGAVIDYYPKAADTNSGVGAILGMASVDYARGQVYFASRFGSSANTLWCLKLGPASDALTFGWAVSRTSVGNFDGSPVLRGDRVYAGNNAGVLWAVNATSGAPLYSYATGDLSVKGFPFPDRRNGDLYFTTTYLASQGRLHAVTDTGSGLVAKVGWGSPPVGQRMSPPLLWTGSNRIFVGVELAASGGGLFSVSATNGSVTGYDLEPSPVAIGTPSLDIGQSPPLLHVGGENGVLYAFEVP
jgi:outer membrane protein assembly factor BamB